MRETKAEKFLAQIVAWGTAFTTILVISGSVTDPVNTPKFVSLGVVGSAAILVLALSLKTRLKTCKPLILVSVCFLLYY